MCIEYLATHSSKPKHAVVVPAMAPVLTGTPGKSCWAGPALGQHTDAILRDELGLTTGQVDELRQEGAI